METQQRSKPMADHTVQEIAKAEAAAFRGTDPVVVRSIFPLMRLLLDGEPVSGERFAVSAGIPPEEAREVFERLRAWGAEFDAEGNFVGAGLTLAPTHTTTRWEGAGSTRGARPTPSCSPWSWATLRRSPRTIPSAVRASGSPSAHRAWRAARLRAPSC